MWKEMAIKIGCDGKRCLPAPQNVLMKFTATCSFGYCREYINFVLNCNHLFTLFCNSKEKGPNMHIYWMPSKLMHIINQTSSWITYMLKRLLTFSFQIQKFAWCVSGVDMNRCTMRNAFENVAVLRRNLSKTHAHISTRIVRLAPRGKLDTRTHTSWHPLESEHA